MINETSKRPGRVDLLKFLNFPHDIFKSKWQGTGGSRIFKNSIALFDCETTGLKWLGGDTQIEFHDLMLKVPDLIADLEATRIERNGLRTLSEGILYAYDEAPTAIQWHDIRIELRTLLDEMKEIEL